MVSSGLLYSARLYAVKYMSHISLTVVCQLPLGDRIQVAGSETYLA